MADVKIRVLAEDQASQKLKQVDSALGSFGNAAKGVLTFATSAAAAIGGVALALDQVFEFGKQGAELLLVEERFDRLAASIGTTGDALRNDLGPATDGLVSDSEAMKLATDLMSLGLANTHDEAIRLSGVASQLGMDMNQLVLTLTNQTTMRFDALGVAVDGFDEKVQALEQSGMDADEAFKWAFIQQAEEQIERVGSISDTAAGSFARMDAAVANAGDALKTKFAPFIANAADGLATLLTWTDKINDALEDQEGNLLETTVNWEDYVDGTLSALVAAGRLSDKSAELARAHILESESFEYLLRNYNVGTYELEMLSAAAYNYRNISDEAYSSNVRLNASQQAINASIGPSGMMYAEAAMAMGAYTTEAEYAATATVAFATDAEVLASRVNDAAGAFGNLSGSFPNLGSMIEGALEEIEFLTAGGGDILSLYNAILPADLPADVKQRLLEQTLELYNTAKTAVDSSDDLGVIGAVGDDISAGVGKLFSEMQAEEIKFAADLQWTPGGAYDELISMSVNGITIPVWLDVRGDLVGPGGSTGTGQQSTRQIGDSGIGVQMD